MRIACWILTFIAMSFATENATAQWVYRDQESAFGGSTTHLALTVAPRGYALGLRCIDDEIIAIFMTPEEIDQDSANVMSALSPLIKLRIDEGQVHDLPVKLESSDDGNLTGMAAIEKSHIEEIRDARRRVAVAFEMMGDLYHESDFGVAGSTAASNSLLEHCNTNAGN